MYPVEGVTLSVLYESYMLASSDFDGKDPVTKEELIKYLVNKSHPEYTIAEDVRAKYDKDRNMVVVVASESSKGAVANDTPVLSKHRASHIPSLEGFNGNLRKFQRGFLEPEKTFAVL